MHRVVTRSSAVIAALFAATAWANHAMPPINLVQQSPLGTTLTTGTTIPPSDIFLTADAPAGTNGSGFYRLEIEVALTSAAWTGTPTVTSDCLGGNGCATAYAKPGSNVTYPFTKIAGLGPGTYKWRCRMTATGSPTVSSWVDFNAGLAAFTIANPNVPDIMVTNVALANVQATATELKFNVSGNFTNRGTVSTGNFTWNAYLSTDKVLSTSADTLLFSSTTPIDVAGLSTLTDSSSQIILSPRPASGSYYVIIEADPAPAGCTTSCGQVIEFDELNNIAPMANYFVNGIDLVAKSISNGPLQAGPGVPITLNIEFFNQGVDAPANPVDFRIYLTRNQQGTFPYEVYSNAITVGGGQVIATPITFTLPPGVAGGDVWWALEVDQNNQVTELSESNNLKLTTGQTHVQQAELMATKFDLVDIKTLVSTRKADIGFPARFQATADNLGDWASVPTMAGVIISRDNTLSLLGDDLFAEVAMPSVNWQSPNNSTTFDALVTIPTKDKKGTLANGEYYFFVYVDSLNLINEVNESNNHVMVQGPVQLRLPSPDYALTRVVSVEKAAGGEAVPVTRTIKNIGTQDGAQVDYRCFASPNSIITTQDFPLRFVQPDGTSVDARSVQLTMGSEDTATEIVRLPGTIPAGNYYFGCIVDPANTLPELDEQNNARATGLAVGVAQQTFRVVTQQIPDGVIGLPYTFRLTSVGAPTGSVMWKLGSTTQPPAGLGISSDGTLSGTPRELGVTTFKVIAESGDFQAEQVLVARILPPTTQLVITSDNLPPLVNSPSFQYQGSLSASGGVQPYTWSIVSGALPSGITLQAGTGLISGSPRQGLPNGEVKLLVRVRDTLGATAEKEIRLRILAPGALSISTLVLPDALVDTEYFGPLSAEVVGGGLVAKPVTWRIVSGRLPEGLALIAHTDQVTGIIQGQAKVAGTYPLTIQASDADGRTDVVDFVIRIFSAHVTVFLAEGAPKPVSPGDSVDLTVSSNGAGAKFRLYSGSLPPGVTLAATGKITGTVAEEEGVYGVYNFVVEAVDAAGGTGLGAFSLEVVPRPVATGCGNSATGGLPNALLALIALGGFALLRRRARS